MTCIVYKACQRVCARAPKPSALSSPHRRVYTMAKKQNNKHGKENFKRRADQVHSVPRTVHASAPGKNSVLSAHDIRHADSNRCDLGCLTSLQFVGASGCSYGHSRYHSEVSSSRSSRKHLLQCAYTHHITHILTTSRIYSSHRAYFNLGITTRVLMDVVKYQARVQLVPRRSTSNIAQLATSQLPSPASGTPSSARRVLEPALT